MAGAPAVNPPSSAGIHQHPRSRAHPAFPASQSTRTRSPTSPQLATPRFTHPRSPPPAADHNFDHSPYALHQRAICHCRTPSTRLPAHTQGGHHRAAPIAIPGPRPPHAQPASPRIPYGPQHRYAPSPPPQSTPASRRPIDHIAYSLKHRISSQLRIPPRGRLTTPRAATTAPLPSAPRRRPTPRRTIPQAPRLQTLIPVVTSIARRTHLNQRITGQVPTPITQLPSDAQGGHHRVPPIAIPGPEPSRFQPASPRTRSPCTPAPAPAPSSPTKHISYSLKQRMI